MKELYDRTQRLIGADAMYELKDARVLLVGLGGVGGYVAEALARAGVGTIGLCDFDRIDATNLNRQIIATVNNIGSLKTDAWEDRIRSINPDCNIKKYSFKLDGSRIRELDIQTNCPEGYKVCSNCGRCLKHWDFVSDAIDDVPAKIALTEACVKMNIPVISSMGTGNKLDPFSFKIVPIQKTEGDPLARAVRKKLREKGIEDVPVLYSSEPSIVEISGGDPIPSISYMPAVAGLEIASYIIKKIISQNS